MATVTCEPRALFTVQDARYVVKAKGRDKEILRGISLRVSTGQVMAIMGPSGAGKSMLMNLLTLEHGPGRRWGLVRLNGARVTGSLLAERSSLVTQADNHWAFLRCRETLEFVAAFHHRSPAAERRARVDGLLRKMGLEVCQHTRVGNQFIPGLSGGQRRRLSIAVAMMKEPLVLFLDEPTSGLDAAAAAGIMSFLKEIAAANDIIVICTIHQPSAKVFASFDQLLLLSSGLTAYCGPAAAAAEYFARIGRPFPVNENPADFLLDVVNREFTEPAAVDHVLDSWRSATACATEGGASEPHSDCSKAGTLPVAGAGGLGLLGQVAVLLRRQSLLILRDPTTYSGRMVANLVACMFFSIVYLKSRDRLQEQVLNRLWLIIWIIAVPTNLAVVAVFSLNQEFVNVQKETKDGMYKLSAYLIAQTLLQVPLMVILSVCAISVAGYGISNWNGDGYFVHLAVHAACLWAFECFAQLCSVLFENPLLGMLISVFFWFCNFLFCGIFITDHDIVWPLRVFSYIIPYSYSLPSLAFAEFHGTFWDGAVPDVASPRGFACPGDPMGLICFGHTGTQVLESVHRTLSIIKGETTFDRDIGLVLAIAVCFKVVFVMLAARKCSGASPPLPPVPQQSTATGQKTSGPPVSVLTVNTQGESSVPQALHVAALKSDCPRLVEIL